MTKKVSGQVAREKAKRYAQEVRDYAAEQAKKS